MTIINQTNLSHGHVVNSLDQVKTETHTLTTNKENHSKRKLTPDENQQLAKRQKVTCEARQALKTLQRQEPLNGKTIPTTILNQSEKKEEQSTISSQTCPIISSKSSIKADNSKITKVNPRETDIKEFHELAIDSAKQLLQLYHTDNDGNLTHIRTKALLPFKRSTLDELIQKVTSEMFFDHKKQEGLMCTLEGHVFETVKNNGKLTTLYSFQKLNAGSHSTAYLTFDLINGCKKVLKVANIHFQDGRPGKFFNYFKETMVQERAIIEKIHLREGDGKLCPYVIEPASTAISHLVLFGFLYPYYNGGDLLNVLQKAHPTITIQDRLSFAYQLWTLYYETVCKRGYLHPDIKLENILVNFSESGTMRLVLADMCGTKFRDEAEDFSPVGLSRAYQCILLLGEMEKAKLANDKETFRSRSLSLIRYNFAVCMFMFLASELPRPISEQLGYMNPEAELNTPALKKLNYPTCIVEMMKKLLHQNPESRHLNDTEVFNIIIEAIGELSNDQSSASEGYSIPDSDDDQIIPIPHSATFPGYLPPNGLEHRSTI